MKYLLILSLILLTSVTTLALGNYLSTFNGSLSGNLNDWGAFGSFISGTIGVTVAFLAVSWLIISVVIQKRELDYLKDELKKSADEQKDQTIISALTATVNSIGVSVSVAQQKLNACNDGTNHFLPGETEETIKAKMLEDVEEMNDFTSELKSKLEQAKNKG